MPMNVLPGRRLKAPVSVGGGTAVDAASFVMVVLVKSVNAFRAARTIVDRTAINTFRSHNYPLYKNLNISILIYFYRIIWLLSTAPKPKQAATARSRPGIPL